MDGDAVAPCCCVDVVLDATEPPNEVHVISLDPREDLAAKVERNHGVLAGQRNEHGIAATFAGALHSGEGSGKDGHG
jgi:hypothetical protein